jgi:Gluconate 2-dehydrogenase subunit 3
MRNVKMNQPIKSPVSLKKAAFNEVQMAVLNALIDLLIPASPDRRMPAAKSLALFADISDMPAKDRALFEGGLAELQARSTKRHGVGFAQLDASEAKTLADAVRSEGSPFVQCFMTQTVGRYLAHDVVMPLIGLDARPPWPQGNSVAEGDWSLLDVVRKRAKIYREV